VNRATLVYLMREKGEASLLLQNFVTMVTTQFARNVKKIRSDNGLEFLFRPMKHLYQQQGITHHTSYIETRQQNGTVKRKHRHILIVARALCFQAHLPFDFLGRVFSPPHI